MEIWEKKMTEHRKKQRPLTVDRSFGASREPPDK